MTNLSSKTRPGLLSALKKAAGVSLSAQQVHKQKVGYILSLDKEQTMTREKVESELRKIEGNAA